MLVKRREEREQAEKQAEVEREKKRIEMGKGANKTREEIEALRRKRDIELRKKEKEDFRRERERLRKQIESDRAERRSRQGLPTHETEEEHAVPEKTPEQHMNDNIILLKEYKTGGEGKRALSTLRVYINNALTKDEEKYQKINLSNDAFRRRVGALAGGKAFLKAVGFQEVGGELVLEQVDHSLLELGLRKLDQAISSME